MNDINPPRHGEGDHEVVEGQPHSGCNFCLRGCPTTTLRAVPLPVPGRNKS